MNDRTNKIKDFVQKQRFIIGETAHDDPRGAIACIRLQAAWDTFWEELTSPSTAQ